MTREVAESLKKFPIQIRGRRAPIKPDEEQPDESDALKLLPPPLMPQKFADASQSVAAEQAFSIEVLDKAPTDDLDLFAIQKSTPVEEEATASGPLSLTVQGRIIPCIPCENVSQSSDHHSK